MNLAEYCATCEAETERIVNDLVQELADLKAAHEQEIEQFKQQPTLTYDQQYLLDLCAQMAQAWRPKFYGLTDGIQEIIRASDKCQGIVSDPKTGQIVEKEGSA